MLADLGFRCRPLDSWPGEPTRNRLRDPFGAAWGPTVALLRRELRHLGAKGARSILVAVREEDILLDGSGPKARAIATHPGVVLSFDSRYGPLKYACDRFANWQANVRAIALGLEALRRVERYGISRRGEQYQGYKQLPGSVAEMTPDVAANILERHSRIPASAIRSDGGVAEAAYRLAAKATHPDAGGNAEDFKAVQQAREALAKGPANTPGGNRMKHASAAEELFS